MERRRGSDSRILRFERDGSHIEVDGDTVRVKLPGKERFATFALRGVTDAFFLSPRTEQDAKLHGLHMQLLLPMELVIPTQDKEGIFGPRRLGPTSDAAHNPRGITYAEAAEGYGLTENEVETAQDIAWASALESLRPKG